MNPNREESILLSLKKLDYLSRIQLQKLHDLKGERNARRVLANLSEFVGCFRGENGENIYHLTKAGRERTDCLIARQKTNQAAHYLMRNDVYIFYHHEDWRNEMKFTVDKEVTLIADSYFRFNMRRHFLEVDHLQHMIKNREKVERYRKLNETGVFQAKMKYFPKLVWVTLTESRRKQLLSLCEGLDVTVHVWQEIR